jgi:hypothetical protein
MTNPFSWFRRIFSSFGSDANCIDLVERARQGDQNATATIILVRKNALAGNELAKRSLAEILKYSKETSPPPTHIGYEANALRQSCIAGEAAEVLGAKLSKLAMSNPDTAVVTVANACDANELAKKLDELIQSDAFRKAFDKPNAALRAMHKVPHEAQHALLLGFVLGLATRIQCVRKPNSPIAILSRGVAWEVGQ